jgi:hypothetical protein
MEKSSEIFLIILDSYDILLKLISRKIIFGFGKNLTFQRVKNFTENCCLSGPFGYGMTQAPRFVFIATSIDLIDFRNVSGDKWEYLAVMASVLWPISSFTWNKSVPSATNQLAKLCLQLRIEML